MPVRKRKKYKRCCLAADETTARERVQQQALFDDEASDFDFETNDEDEFFDVEDGGPLLDVGDIVRVCYTRGLVRKLSDLRSGRDVQVTEWNAPDIPLRSHGEAQRGGCGRETLIEAHERTPLRAFSAPDQRRSKLRGIARAQDVRIRKFFRERSHLFAGLNFVPPGTKLAEQTDCLCSFFGCDPTFANEPRERTPRLERRSPPHHNASEFALQPSSRCGRWL